jgi:Holliday junction resolvasome, endonuclease subunit
MPRVLAIDPGGRCGFGVVDDDGLVLSGCWHLVKSGERHGIRFWRLFHRLSEVYAAAGPFDVVGWETKFALPGASTMNLRVTGGYEGVLKAWCEQLQITDYRGIAPSSLKKRATGNGRAEKADMAAEACRRTGKDIRDDNEADAVCLAFVVHEELTRA